MNVITRYICETDPSFSVYQLHHSDSFFWGHAVYHMPILMLGNLVSHLGHLDAIQNATITT